MNVDPSSYSEIPENRHGVRAGSILLPTTVPIVAGGGTSLDFVRDQGGDEETFIFLFGVRPVFNLLGMRVDVLEGVFLNASGPGFFPTWDVEQLAGELDRGGWKLVPTDDVLEGWTERVEARMNA